jgi:hypothetical protein
MTLLVLQHIACEPPAAFEDELRARGLDLVRVELDEGEQPPDWRDFDGMIVMGGPMGAYIEVPPALAREWGEVPAYAVSLERTLGPGALAGFLADVEASAGATLPLARSLFGRWLEHAVGVPERVVG